MDGTILVADDDRTIRTVLTQAFTRAGCRVHATASLNTLLRWVEEGRGDLVVSDVVMPDGNGLETLPRIAKLRPGLPVILISAQNTIMTAIQAAEAAAWDYLPKPFDLPDLMKRAARALEQSRHRPKPAAPGSPAGPEGDDLPLIGRSAAMQDLYRLIARLLHSPLPVLISGESGTGKSLIARVIHDHSDRRTLPMAVVPAAEMTDPAAIRQALADAGRGSVLFDEIGDLPAPAQAWLARALDQAGDSAPRLLTTSQIDLAQAVAEGRFRDDLYYRIAAVTLEVPPLRLRTADIPLLAEHMLARLAAQGGEPRSLSPEALAELRKHPWPGNVRQLENAVQRLALTSPDPVIDRAQVLAALGPAEAAPASPVRPGAERLSDSIAAHLQRYFDLHGDDLPPAGLYQRILREMERPLIEIALDATGGNQAKCAELLGINRNTLRKKITSLDISVTRRRKLM